MNNPLVSVLIPAYNHEKYIQETIKSVINQTYRNIEMIIIDDGSKDFTWQKIQEMKDECKNRFARIVFETKKNEGTCRTLNLLKNYAQGGYIFITASDDVLKPECIEKELEFLSKNPEYCLCAGDNEFIDADGKVCYWGRNRNIVYDENEACYKTFSSYFIKDNSLLKNFGRYNSLYKGNYIPNGYLIKSEIFNKIEFTPEAPLEDWYLMLQLSKYAEFKYLPEILFSYRWHDNNTVKNIQKMKDYCRRTRDYENKILSNINLNGLKPEVRQVIDFGSVLFHFTVIKSLLEVFIVLKPEKFPHRIIIKIFDRKYLTVFKL